MREKGPQNKEALGSTAEQIARVDVEALGRTPEPVLEKLRAHNLLEKTIQALTVVSALAGSVQPERAEASTLPGERVERAFEAYDSIMDDIEERKQEQIIELNTDIEVIKALKQDTQKEYEERMHDVRMTEGTLEQEIALLKEQAKDDEVKRVLLKDRIEKLENKKELVRNLTSEARKKRIENIKQELKNKLDILKDQQKAKQKEIEGIKKEIERHDKISSNLRRIHLGGELE